MENYVMSIFQLGSAVFALYMLYVVQIHRRKLNLSLIEMLTWRSLWSIFIFLSLFPQSLAGIVEVLHFARVFDLLLVMALMVLTILVVTSYFRQREYGRKLEKLVRSTALLEKLMSRLR